MQHPVPPPDLSILPPFHGVLFPPGMSGQSAGPAGPADCFTDLNLDQVVGAAVGKGDEADLHPVFHAPLRDEAVIRYRQAIFADLRRPDGAAPFGPFRDAMRSVRAGLAYADRTGPSPQQDAIILHTALAYRAAVEALLAGLRRAPISSPGLLGLRDHLIAYLHSPPFVAFAAEAASVQTGLEAIEYATLFRDDTVTVRPCAGEPDDAVTVRERFARFQGGPAVPDPPPSPPRGTDISLNHVEAAILGFVARLFPAPFAALRTFAARHGSFMDGTLVRLDREIGFFLGFLAVMAPLERAGLPFCTPRVSASDRTMVITGCFDLALAIRLAREGCPLVLNDAALRDGERLMVVTGPNQGGKTTFARALGQLHVLAALGCPVPAKQAHLFLPDQVLTHFERSEDIANLRGKLEDELVHLRRSCDAATANSLVILNEVFNSTGLDDQAFLSREILERIAASGAACICVTFLDELSTLDDRTVSMVSSVSAEDPAVRTFAIRRRPADGLAFALSLAERRGLTLPQLRTRLRP